jgi:hypothetical protein
VDPEVLDDQVGRLVPVVQDLLEVLAILWVLEVQLDQVDQAGIFDTVVLEEVPAIRFHLGQVVLGFLGDQERRDDRLFLEDPAVREVLVGKSSNYLLRYL